MQVVHIRACVEETGASKLFIANITGNFGDFAFDNVIDTRRRRKMLRVRYSLQKEAYQICS